MCEVEYYYLFPFEKVGRGEKIIIYGNGCVGQWFFSQIQDSQYAQVIAIADQASEMYDNANGLLITPDRIVQYQFDKIVIAIENEKSAYVVRNILVNDYNVDLSKIVLGYKYKKEIPSIKRPFPVVNNNVVYAYQIPGTISLAVWGGGGIGDNIILKRKIDEIMKLQKNLCIDLYTMPKFATYIKSIYGDNAYGGRLNAILDYGPILYEKEKRRYVFSLYRGIDLYVDWVDKNRLKLEDANLLRCINTLERRLKNHDYWKTTEMAIHYALCEKRKLNAYTSANRDGGIQVTDFHTDIPLNIAVEKDYYKLNLRKYITINVGFDNIALTEKLQTKCWPIDNFSMLVSVLKRRYHNIEFLQIDGNGTPKVSGCDRYFIGENIELVKYILKWSMLHISIEGGLVHLASQLDTKCIVLFGPTPLKYYGYDSNINLQAGTCHNCLWLEPNNHFKCCRNLSEPECMISITPKIVCDAAISYLNSITELGDSKR
ncbi:glycosyltransferase family 9 protein [Selenomonas ruminantium]|uniref:ADP-heptose:LPS heptosyltransferase n=1 Tax=Selenomonas ruminantium TaxID=971 RepID=A0A1K1N9Y4_SELRU|nr:glycosyltransferase family 9 protein [Selenomonas ruminantium]SFW32097.1 ADP-heptose:LPS heptosyltransferase [Selenomonas ruminantium]